jgi:hypothetical protein
MYKYAFACFLLLCKLNSIGQSSAIFLRHDTTNISSDNAEWSLGKIPGSEKVRTLPFLFLDGIATKKYSAIDPTTNEVIPAGKIYQWRTSEDTTMTWDEKKQENVIKVVRAELKPGDFSRIKIYHDWYADPATGKMTDKVTSVVLFRDIWGYETKRGSMPFCRIDF